MKKKFKLPTIKNYPPLVIVLSDADSDRFLEHIKNPPRPSKELVSLFAEPD